MPPLLRRHLTGCEHRLGVQADRASVSGDRGTKEHYHDVVNAILDGPSPEANVSFKAHWHGVRRRRHVHNTQHRF